MKTVLVVGAGATIEECLRSGNYKNDKEYLFPTITNFAKKFFLPLPFPISEVQGDRIGISNSYNPPALNIVLQQYLTRHKIAFDDRLLNQKGFLATEMKNSSVNVFFHLEENFPDKHNVERLFQFAWKKYSQNNKFWEAFVHQSIYYHLTALFTQQFGMGPGVEMKAGRKVVELLSSGDKVINLNYDICFDLALVQTGTQFAYSPDQQLGGITVFKPHGSMNLYVNSTSGNFYFVPPDQISTTGAVQRDGITYSPLAGLLPPIMEKNYKNHACASFILDSGQPFTADRMILWGVGLTDSDTDLLKIYRDLGGSVKESLFINPSPEAYRRAKQLLNCPLRHVTKLDEIF